jgi:hypothetical protein
MYAGSDSGTYRGMSGPEILNFFRSYSDTIEPYPYKGGEPWGLPPRWKIFEDCLARFPLDLQQTIIQDLLDHRGPMKWGLPQAADIEQIREWLVNDILPGERIDGVRITRNGLQITLGNKKITAHFSNPPHFEFPASLRTNHALGSRTFDEKRANR